MRAVIQRVTSASVSVDDETTGAIQQGLLVLLGSGEGDSADDVDWMSNKIAGLRIFEDDDGKMNLSVSDIEGEVLLVPQFTLYGDCRKGRRPSFVGAADPDIAEQLVEEVSAKLRAAGLHVEEGVFGAEMEVSLLNDGPVTILLDSEKQF
jgi:D-tyrosyl-tRNA(Tyr) deacylase